MQFVRLDGIVVDPDDLEDRMWDYTAVGGQPRTMIIKLAHPHSIGREVVISPFCDLAHSDAQGIARMAD